MGSWNKKIFSQFRINSDKEAVIKNIISNENLKLFLEECMKEINVNFHKELNWKNNYYKVNQLTYPNDSINQQISDTSNNLLRQLHWWPQDTFLFIIDYVKNEQQSNRYIFFDDTLPFV